MQAGKGVGRLPRKTRKLIGFLICMAGAGSHGRVRRSKPAVLVSMKRGKKRN